MTAKELRNKFLKFFVSKGHAVIPSASLIPENDPTALFINSGMQPLVPYLLGEKHPKGNRLVDSQKCIRTIDIEEVGDDTHLTFFEMLGNWSLGDYFKKEAIGWSVEFLTDKKWLGIPLSRLAISVYKGDDNVSRDEESADLWKGLGVSEERVAYLGREDNWWGPAGETGPCGPDTEVFYWVPNDIDPPAKFDPSDDRWMEIWNNVFMEYNKTSGGDFEPLDQKNVDTGMGLERVLVLLNGLENVYQTDLFKDLILWLGEDTPGNRIFADHIRAAVFLIADGVRPSNNERGYVLRRLIRRAIIKRRNLEFDYLALEVISMYRDQYPNLGEKKDEILTELNEEKALFEGTLGSGLKKLKTFKDGGDLSGEDAFLLYQSYGFPLELIEEEVGYSLKDKFEKELKKHQNLSRTAAKGKFKAGLADHSEETTRLHTATHLLHRALKDILGDHVVQAGSNITKERLRFDFTHPDKLSEEEVGKVEEIVNEKIGSSLDVKRTLEGEISHYHIGEYSTEKCAGPHVSNTKELGKFKIIKEESSSRGVRRIRATLS